MLCADDFGLSIGVSQGISMLARSGRLNAVSCMVNMPHWASSAPLLRDLPDGVELGLHFTLTEGAACSSALRAVWPRLPGLAALIARAHLGALPRDALAAEFAAQYHGFVEATGREPNFIDGHQHVHHLPVVREVMLDAISAHAPSTGIAVRNTAHVLGPGFGVKRALIEGTGGRRLQCELVRRGIAHNAALLGVYDFRPGSYGALMRAWLAGVPAQGALLFCHPGLAEGASASDAIAAARSPEAEYLASEEFMGDLREAGVRLERVWQQAPASGQTSTSG